MTDFFLRSTDGSDADNGTTWALAKATLAGAFAVAAAGDTIYVSKSHAETQAGAMTLTSPGTAASPVRVLCVDDTADPVSPTTLATTATVSTTTTGTMVCQGYAYVYGVKFNVGSGANNTSITWGTNATASWWWRMDSCQVFLVATGNSMAINVGTSAGANVGTGLLEFINTKVSFAHAAQGFNILRNFIWKNTASATAGTVPTVLFTPRDTGVNGGFAQISGVDLSAMSGALVDVSKNCGSSVRFENCKLHASATVTTGTSFGQNGTRVDLVNCDSGNTNYRFRRNRYQGNEYSETTIVRTSGATDGTTPVSRKMVSSANSKIYSPLESEPIYFWNETVGAINVAVAVVTDNATLTDADAWIEVEYLGTSGFPLSLLGSDRAADVLATPANQTTDGTSTWTTTGLTTPVKQTLSTSVTTTGKGVVKVRVMLAKASTTMYVDPLVQVS